MRLSRCELQRKGVSYTVDTVRFFRRKFPGATLFLIIGEDQLKSLPSWRSPDMIARMATFAVYRRKHAAPRVAVKYPVVVLPGRLFSHSSTAVRNATRRKGGIRRAVLPEVASYITEHQLYQPPS
jgi:nicotinate-nucleotide adenylyltransferase